MISKRNRNLFQNEVFFIDQSYLPKELLLLDRSGSGAEVDREKLAMIKELDFAKTLVSYGGAKLTGSLQEATILLVEQRNSNFRMVG